MVVVTFAKKGYSAVAAGREGSRMCLTLELVRLRHPWVDQGKWELAGVWANGSGTPLEPQWGDDVTGRMKPPKECAKSGAEGTDILLGGHYGP